MPKIPCQSINSPIKFSNQGTLFVAPLPAPPPMGGGVFDASTWTLSNYTAAGWPIDWERDLAVGDSIAVLTGTGYQVVTIDAIVVGPDVTTLTVTQVTTEGILVDDQITGVWKITASELPCPPPPLAPLTTDQFKPVDRAGKPLPDPVVV